MSESAVHAASGGNGAVHVELGERLRAIRQLRRKTLKDVAGAAGVSESFLSQLERGRTNATIATLQRIATSLGIEVSDLFTTNARRQRVLRSGGREFFAWGELGR
jgi:transcriptional regulator with XRE-family HTH domain